MGEDAGGGADEVGTASVVGAERDDDDGGVGQGDLTGDGRPAGERGALQAEEQENAAEEAFDTGALAQLLLRPGGRQAGAILEALGIEGDDGGGADDGVDPGDERGAPLSGVETDDTRPEGIEGDGGLEQGRGEGGVVAVGGGEAEEHGQARAAAEQGMDAIAAQDGGGMMGRGMTVLRIGIGATPGFNGCAVDDQVARADDALPERLRDGEHEERFAGRRAGAGRALPLLRGAGHPGHAVGAGRQPTGERQRQPGAQPVGQGARREAPERAQQRDQQQRLLCVAAGSAPRPCGQGRRAAPLGLLDRQTAQREQMQARHERERVNVQGGTTFRQGALVCRGRDRGRGDARSWDHGLTSSARGPDRALEVSLPHPAHS